MLVIRATQKKSGRLVEGFSLSDWVMSSYEELYVLKMEQVVTITEMDNKIKGFYTSHLSREDDDVPTDKMSKEMGYLGSVTDQKSKLEDLFNKS